MSGNTNTPNYLQNPFDCSCLNDNSKDESDNFWRHSGSCCANLRLTIWLAFNLIFIVLVILICLKVREEKAWMLQQLENFEDVDDLGMSDDDIESHNSIMKPFVFK